MDVIPWSPNGGRGLVAFYAVHLLQSGKDDDELQTLLLRSHGICMLHWARETLSPATDFYFSAPLDDSVYNRDAMLAEMNRIAILAFEKCGMLLDELIASFRDDDRSELSYYVAYFEKLVQQRHVWNDAEISAFERSKYSHRRNMHVLHETIAGLNRQITELREAALQRQIDENPNVNVIFE